MRDALPDDPSHLPQFLSLLPSIFQGISTKWFQTNILQEQMFAEKTNYGCVWTRSTVPKAFPAAYSTETPSVQNVFFIDMAIVIKTLFEYNVENCRDGNKAHYCGQHPSRSHVYPV